MLDRLSNALGRFPAARRLIKRAWYAKKYALRRWEGPRELQARYERFFGRPLDLADPHLFTQKLYRRMIRWHETGSAEFTALADKLRVRDFVASRVGEKYLTTIYWQGEDPGRIPFDTLPDDYVLKTNHGSAHVIVVRGQVDRSLAIERLRSWLAVNHYWKEREYQYLEIEPRVYAEQFLDDGQDAGPLDYRFWCFGGSPCVVQVDNNLHDVNPFYDLDWNPLALSYRRHIRPVQFERPGTLDEMLEVARSLSRPFDFVRVDLYSVRGQVYFGEMTFTPVAGCLKFQPEHWDREFGALWGQ